MNLCFICTDLYINSKKLGVFYSKNGVKVAPKFGVFGHFDTATAI
jgi:hypothetical protein